MNAKSKHLQKALADVADGLSLRKTALKYNISRSKLWRFAKNINKSEFIGGKTIMSEDEEVELKMRIEKAYEMGKPMTRRDIQETAFDIMKLRMGDKTRVPGAKWCRLFYRRHDVLSKIANANFANSQENFADLINHHEKCRLCLTHVENGIRFQITKEIVNRTFNLLGVQLIPSEIYSNYICDLCNVTLSNYSDYRNAILTKQRQLSSFLSRVKEATKIDDEVLNLGIEVYDALESEFCSDNHHHNTTASSSLNSSLIIENVDHHFNDYEIEVAMEELRNHVDILSDTSQASCKITTSKEDQKNDIVLTSSSTLHDVSLKTSQNEIKSAVVEEYLNAEKTNEIIIMKNSSSSSSTQTEKSAQIEAVDNENQLEEDEEEEIENDLENEEEDRRNEMFQTSPKTSEVDSSVIEEYLDSESSDDESFLADENESFTSSFYELNCRFCNETFYNSVDLMLHHNIDHKESLKSNETIAEDTQHLTTCNICGMEFKKSSLYHYLRYHAIKGLECDFCGKKFSTKYFLRNHVMSHIPKYSRERKFRCEECGKSFASNSLLCSHRTYSHTIRDNSEDLTCHICNKQLKTKSCLKAHINSVHYKQNARASCDKCGKSYSTKYERDKHFRLNHIDDNNREYFVCQKCGKLYRTAELLRKHKQAHLEAIIECNFDGCHKKFKTKQKLDQHQKFVHLKVEYKCSFPGCKKQFKSNQSCNFHFKIEHENYKSKCPVDNCLWTGSRRDYMKRHLKTKHEDLSSEKLDEFFRKTYEMMLA